MKDEWDLFAAVHRSLMDGQQLVTVRQHIYSLERPEDGNYGMATDEAGEEYELSNKFTEVFLTCINEYKISWTMTPQSEFLRVFEFGPALNKPAQPTDEGEGTTTINLLKLDPNDPATNQIFKDVQKAIDGEDEEGDEWKALLHPDN
jgi:hypothetical protein